jgi:hypothetical protein
MDHQASAIAIPPRLFALGHRCHSKLPIPCQAVTTCHIKPISSTAGLFRGISWRRTLRRLLLTVSSSDAPSASAD